MRELAVVADDPAALVPAIRAALDGTGPAVLPLAAGAVPPEVPDRVPLPVAVVVATSGTSGAPKAVAVSSGALLASAAATESALGGPGGWVLALPGHYIAGVQVIVRAVAAGTEPIPIAPGPFTARALAEAVLALPPERPRYTALVPTQLHRVVEAVEAGDADVRAAVHALDAVLIGGGRLPVELAERADAVGLQVHRTYGASETAGGCVYDGVPLPVSEVHIDNDGHVVLGGATVAHGYLGEPALTADVFAVDADGTRWFRTDDLGRLDDEGRLQIVGRADDVINTGGLKVTPGTVEDALSRFVPGVRDVVVVGTAHRTWGEAVSAAVTLQRGAPTPSLRDVRSALRGVVPDHALPHRLLVLDALPLRGPGKPDRRALVQAFTDLDTTDERMSPQRD